ncbi:MAG: VCBS repeat-containing protein, partial [Deltaproteobacteria bacterium]|nr:VCBS repeat-containing protein [Candidatus Anaeroferrophillacea bacterium]
MMAFLWLASPAGAADWSPVVADTVHLLRTAPPAVGQVSGIQGQTLVIGLNRPLQPQGAGTLLVAFSGLQQFPETNLQLTGIRNTTAFARVISGPFPTRPGWPVYPWQPNRAMVIVDPRHPEMRTAAVDLCTALHAAGVHCMTAPAMPAPNQLASGDRPAMIILQPTGTSITASIQEPTGRPLLSRSISRRGNTASFAVTPPPPAPASPPPSFTRPEVPLPGEMPRRVNLKGAYQRLVFADIDGNGNDELLLLGSSWLEAYRFSGLGDLIPVGRFRLPIGDIVPLNLHYGDFNHNGRDELYITLGRKVVTSDEKDDTRLASVVVEFRQGTPQQLGGEYSCYFRVMENRKGHRVLLSQEMDDYKQYRLPIRWAGFFNGKLEVREPYREAHNIFCLDHFVENPFDPQQILVLDFDGGLGAFHAPSEQLLTTADADFGIYDEIVFPQKLAETEYEGGYVMKRTAEERFAARRFTLRNSFGHQAFLIRKGRRVHPEMLEKGISLTKGTESNVDQVVGVQWRAGTIVETWKSPELTRDIIDFAFT